MKLFLLGFLTVVLLAGVIGCETVKGVGRDITGASSSVQKALVSNKK